VTTFLLDVNVFIALLDPNHVHHGDAHNWFSAKGQNAWATCPLTENSVLRILGDQRYPNSPGSPAAVAELLDEFFALPGHAFWPDDVSILDHRRLDPSRLLTSQQVTDTYLLALAHAHAGQLATLDRRLITDAVKAGHQALHLIV
jgi:toxin-antitoxin system PIN domain toxin